MSRSLDLRQTFVPHGFVRDRSSKGHRYTGSIKAAGRSISISITFPDLEFTRLPTVELLKPDEEAPNVVAHLSARGELCFSRNEEVVLDRYEVGRTALFCLGLIKSGLEHVLSNAKLEDEIADEFPQHWHGIPFFYDIKHARSTRAKLYEIDREKSHKCRLLSDDHRSLLRFNLEVNQRERVAKKITHAYVFKSLNRLTFRRNFRTPTRLGQFLAWLESTLPGTTHRAIEQIAKPFPNTSAIFVMAPNGCVGIQLAHSATLLGAQREKGLRRILVDRSAEIPIDRLSGERMDLTHIFSRNLGGLKSLIGSSIALVGCGTIGSHLAKMLVQSGAGHEGGTLILIDNQTLSPGNVGRHFLGLPSIGEAKTSAMRAELTRLFPDTNIIPFQMDAVSCLPALNTFDLVIDATGEEALSFAVNDYLVKQRAKGDAPDFIRVALFGNGDAAQAVLVDGFEYGCLKCLRPEQDRPWHFDPMRPDADALLTSAGCGEGLYMPYGVAAPIIAAAMALQLVIDWKNEADEPRLRTIRINSGRTVAVKDKNPPRSARCPACAQFPPKLS